MSARMLESLQDKFEKNRAHIEMLQERAIDAGRDINDDEFETIKALNEDNRKYRGRIDELLTDSDLAAASQQKIREVVAGVYAGPVAYRSAGELLWDVLHQSDRDAKRRYGTVMHRAAEHMGTVAASTTATAGDLAGLIVKPVVGPVINPFPRGMPLANAVGMREIPISDGFGFMRPHLVDAAFTTGGIGTQSIEKAELVSKHFSIASDTVTLTTYGGYLNVSQQLISFNPAALDIIVAQLRQRLEYQIDKAVLTEIANSTGKVTLATGTVTAAVLMAAIYAGAAAYYNATYTLPEWIAMGPLGWARLGGTVDTAGRPLFPTLGAVNAPGSAAATAFSVTVAGLMPVVTPTITDDSYWIGGSAAIEGYIYNYPVLEAVEPSVLGRQIAVAAAIGTFRPTSFPNALIHLAP